MANLQPIICPLSDKPKSFTRRGMDYINGEWVAKPVTYCTGTVKSHVAKTLKGNGRYYV